MVWDSGVVMALKSGRLARIFAVFVVIVGSTFVVSTGPARAAGSFALGSVVVVEAENAYLQGGHSLTISSAAAEERHPIRIQVPFPLANAWYAVQDATCDPELRTGIVVSERVCRPNGVGSTRLVILYQFGHTNPPLVNRTFTVTATDTVTGETASGTVRVVAHADLDLDYFIARTAGPYDGLHSQIYGSAVNWGPSWAYAATLRVTFTGSFALGSLPSGCTAAGAVVTCALGDVLPKDDVQFSLDLAPASGSFTAKGEIFSETSSDPNTANNVNATGPFQNPGGGGGGSNPPVDPPGGNSGGGNPPGAGGNPPGGGGTQSGTSTQPTSLAASGSIAGPSVTGTPPIAAGQDIEAMASSGVSTADAEPPSPSTAWSVVLVGVAAAVTCAAVAAAFVLLRRRRLTHGGGSDERGALDVHAGEQSVEPSR